MIFKKKINFCLSLNCRITFLMKNTCSRHIFPCMYLSSTRVSSKILGNFSPFAPINSLEKLRMIWTAEFPFNEKEASAESKNCATHINLLIERSQSPCSCLTMSTSGKNVTINFSYFHSDCRDEKQNSGQEDDYRIKTLLF